MKKNYYIDINYRKESKYNKTNIFEINIAGREVKFIQKEKSEAQLAPIKRRTGPRAAQHPTSSITTSRAFNSSNVQVGSTITGNIPVSWVGSQSTVTSVIFANDNSVTSIGSNAFVYCTSLATATIPNSVTSIGSSAFAYTGLTTITIPNSVTSIASYAFRNCDGLTTATIGNSLTEISVESFTESSNLTTVTFTPTSSVTNIASAAFAYCNNLTTITIPNSVTTISSYAFGYTALTTITIPNSVTSIGERAFQYCTSLTTATIGTGVTSIGDNAFAGSTSLATMNCYTTSTAFGTNGLEGILAEQLTIHARTTDATWTDSNDEFTVNIAGGILMKVVKDLT